MKQHQVLIVGGGFGGIKAALKLAKHPEVSVTLLSDQLNFRFYPTLFHTATGGLHQQSSLPLKDILPSSVTLVQGNAQKLDRNAQTITTADGKHLPYDTLILALGSTTNYFGIEGLQEYSFGIKSIEEIDRFKQHIHQQLTDEHKPDLQYVIVGGGPTGIELAGALPGYLRKIMHSHGITNKAVHIDLIEAAPRLLPRSAKKISRAVRRRLRHLGVRLYLGQAVQGETADALMVSGKPIQSHTVIWTAGVANNPFFQANTFQLSDRHKVVVNDYLEAEENIYVIGDNAQTQYSGMAQTALFDGTFVSKDIIAKLQERQRKQYKPPRPVTIISVGPYWASVEWGFAKFAGRLGWLLLEAANLRAFHDYEPWWKAGLQWMTGLGDEESCPICATAERTNQ